MKKFLSMLTLCLGFIGGISTVNNEIPEDTGCPNASLIFFCLLSVKCKDAFTSACAKGCA